MKAALSVTIIHLSRVRDNTTDSPVTYAFVVIKYPSPLTWYFSFLSFLTVLSSLKWPELESLELFGTIESHAFLRGFWKLASKQAGYNYVHIFVLPSEVHNSVFLCKCSMHWIYCKVHISLPNLVILNTCTSFLRVDVRSIISMFNLFYCIV